MSPIKPPISAKRATAVIATARLVKAPDWSETREWQVVAEDGEVLVTVAPSYGGTSRSGRNGWRGWPTALGQSPTGQPHRTREDAAVAGLTDWERWVTRKPTR